MVEFIKDAPSCEEVRDSWFDLLGDPAEENDLDRGAWEEIWPCGCRWFWDGSDTDANPCKEHSGVLWGVFG